MSVTKIERISNLQRSVNYITRKEKTESKFIFSHDCTPGTVKRDFKNIVDLYNEANNRKRELKPRMIYQSYAPHESVTPEDAFKYAKEFAGNYLGEDYQYIIATHYDTDHIHNHIIFNDINSRTLKVFDSSRENTLLRMRNENDRISEKYGLNIIETTRHKHKYLSYREYVAKSKGTSFKSLLENDIDEVIKNADSYEEFLSGMKEKGYEVKEGKHLAFKSHKGKRFLRTKTLGFNYLEKSIRYRLDNKDYIPFKPKIIKREWIDKNQEKFKENKYLQRWATVQNINYLNELYGFLDKEKISFDEFIEQEKVGENITNNFDLKLSKLDSIIYDLENSVDSFDVYKNSYKMITDFKSIKNTSDKEIFKKENFSNFKKYDLAKKKINLLKKVHNINNKKELLTKISDLKEERNIIYETLNLNTEKVKSKEKEKRNYREEDLDR